MCATFLTCAQAERPIPDLVPDMSSNEVAPGISVDSHATAEGIPEAPILLTDTALLASEPDPATEDNDAQADVASAAAATDVVSPSSGSLPVFSSTANVDTTSTSAEGRIPDGTASCSPKAVDDIPAAVLHSGTETEVTKKEEEEVAGAIESFPPAGEAISGSAPAALAEKLDEPPQDAHKVSEPVLVSAGTESCNMLSFFTSYLVSWGLCLQGTATQVVQCRGVHIEFKFVSNSYVG